MRFAWMNLLLLSTACTATPAAQVNDGPVAVEPTDSCRRVSLDAFVGQPRSEALARSLRKASSAQRIRWVEQGMMVTMEYRGDRLTVYLDGAGKFERASCG